MLLSIDGTFIVQLINFAIFFALVNAVFISPVRRSIVARREYIDSVTRDYEGYRGEAAGLRTEAQALISAARRDAEATYAQARVEGQRRAAEITVSYGEQAAREVDSAHEHVAREVAAARVHEDRLVREIGDQLTAQALERVGA